MKAVIVPVTSPVIRRYITRDSIYDVEFFGLKPVRIKWSPIGHFPWETSMQENEWNEVFPFSVSLPHLGSNNLRFRIKHIQDGLVDSGPVMHVTVPDAIIMEVN